MLSYVAHIFWFSCEIFIFCINKDVSCKVIVWWSYSKISIFVELQAAHKAVYLVVIYILKLLDLLNWTSLLHDFIISPWSIWGLLAILVVVLLVQTWSSGLDEGTVVWRGMVSCFWWMGVSMLLSLFVSSYGLYMLCWVLALALYLCVYFMLISYCHKYGEKNRSDAGVIYLFATPVIAGTLAGSMLLKGLIIWVKLIIC